VALAQRDAARRASIAHPVSVAARRDQVAAPSGLEQIDRRRKNPAAFAPPDLDHVVVPQADAEADRDREQAIEDAFGQGRFNEMLRLRHRRRPSRGIGDRK
jgi:hypothetical protein